MFIFIFTFVNELIIINAETLIILGFICLFFIIMFNSDTVEQALKSYNQQIIIELKFKFNNLILQIFHINQVLKTSMISIIYETNEVTNILIPTNSIYTKITHENENSVKNNADIKDLLKKRHHLRSKMIPFFFNLYKFK